MEKYGGSFVQALAKCFLHADRENYFKLKENFPEYWEEYYLMAHKEKTVESDADNKIDEKLS